MKYRKKPVIIDAIQWDGTMNSMGAIRAAFGDNVDIEHGLMCRTLEGPLQATPGDYIIRGVKGEVYPCKPDIFEMTYEAVAE